MVRGAIARSRLLRRAGQSLTPILALAITVASVLVHCAPARAQTSTLLQFPPRPKVTPPVTRRNSEQAPMLLQAVEVRYDYVNKRVTAIGNVQINFRGSALQADRVIYEETAKRLHAEGNVRLMDADGRISYGEIMDLSDDFRDGFIAALRLETPEQTRLAAARANRTGGNITVFHSAVYTACEPCKDDPKKPPLWQIKAMRIIHDQGEKMMYYENAQLEFFGLPVAYMPYFSAPDPTVKRKTGVLTPLIGYSTKTGAWLEVPYYWALAPDYDLTVTPRVMTRQGVLMTGEWRQRLDSGAYLIRLSGVNQLDKSAFQRADGTVTPGFRDFRGVIDTTGQFALNNKWVWGWDSVLPTDATYLQDYGLPSSQRNADPTRVGLSEGVTQIYLVGKGDRSYFDIRSIYYYGFSESDTQRQIPIIHPVMDYDYTFSHPIVGGELSYRVNLTSLTRSSAEYNPINGLSLTTGLCAITAAPGTKIPANCLLRGFPGTYSRFSAETQWRRTYTDSLGQVFTPFVLLRADAASISVMNDPAVANFGLTPGDSTTLRAMPTVGVEYRFPFISVHSWGTQTIEPIAQLILRPNEPTVGKLPNEDSQSLVFDDGNLFKINKFAGWDRIEGGGRANVGLQYTAQVNRGGFLSALFGQSYQLFGTNSFAVTDATNTGLNSGLDTNVSDYVARVSYQPDRIYTFSTRYRFDHDSFALRRFEAEVRANVDRWSVAVTYGNYDAQPLLGFLQRREGILGSTSVKLGANWVFTGAARYDLDAGKFDMTQFGLGYIDDCLIVAFQYITSYTYSGNVTPDHRFVFQIGLRTLGNAGTSTQNLSSPIQ